MKSDNKLSLVLHVLMHLICSDRRWRSKELADHLNTNPVVVRRTLARLRQCGYVESLKGHGGGWKIICDPNQISLLDIYEAVGTPIVFAIGNKIGNHGCLLEKAVHHSLADAFDAAEKLLLHQFKEVKLAQLATEFCKNAAHKTNQQKAPIRHKH